MHSIMVIFSIVNMINSPIEGYICLLIMHESYARMSEVSQMKNTGLAKTSARQPPED